MGNYIGIGLVYNFLEDRLEKEIRSLVNYLIYLGGNIRRIEFSKDEECNEWIEDNLKNNIDIEKLYSPIANGYFGQLQVVCNIFNIRNLNIYIRIEKVGKNYFGLLVDIKEEELLGENSINNISRVTNEIIELLKDLFKVSVYDYAFCDNEGEIKYSPVEFQSLNEKVYSIEVIPDRDDKKNLKVIINDWNIDGLSKRIN